MRVRDGRLAEGWYHVSAPFGTVMPVSMNLRLGQKAAEALRRASRQSGRSQQDLLRDAVDRFLGLEDSEGARARAVATGLVKMPTRFCDITPTIELPPDVRTLDLLDREGDR